MKGVEMLHFGFTVHRPVRWLATVTLVILSAVAIGMAEASPSTATDCRNGAHGFARTPLATPDGKTVRSAALPIDRPVTVEVRSGTFGGAERGWARISGATSRTDILWLDWTRDGGRTWIRCGPFDIGRDDVAWQTPAQRVAADPMWRFRACGAAVARDGHLNACTSWW